jgi:ABC-type nitrate/sulfonate/bicarbonate transport system substrate-binding protein
MQGYMLSLVLAQGGLTLQDVEISKLSAPAALQALQSGSTPLAISVEPWITRMVQGNDGEVLQSASVVLPNGQYSVVLFSERLLQSPDLGRRVAQAYLDAVRQYQAGPTDRNVEIIAGYTDLERQLLKQICWAAIPVDGHVNLDSIMAYQSWAVAQGLLDQVVSADKFWDGRFVQGATGTP